jgi:DNA-binding transcriptional ArsR family regulator
MTTLISQNRSSEILAQLFASKARGAVLRVFMLDPMRAYYQRQLEAATGLPIRAVQRELERLTAMGLLYRRIEGNRSYYQADPEFALFPELRGMILKTSVPIEVLRGTLALEHAVRLLFLGAAEDQVLAVYRSDEAPALSLAGTMEVVWMSVSSFMEALSGSGETLKPFLEHGVDLFGRREDVIWRHIEAAGYIVAKGDGIP